MNPKERERTAERSSIAPRARESSERRVAVRRVRTSDAPPEDRPSAPVVRVAPSEEVDKETRRFNVDALRALAREMQNQEESHVAAKALAASVAHRDDEPSGEVLARPSAVLVFPSPKSSPPPPARVPTPAPVRPLVIEGPPRVAAPSTSAPTRAPASAPDAFDWRESNLAPRPPAFRRAHELAKMAAIVGGFAVATLALMAVLGPFVDRLSVRAGVAAATALLVPGVLAGALRPKDDPLVAVGLTSETYALALLGFAVAFVIGAHAVTSPLLAREGDRAARQGHPVVAHAEWFLARVEPR